jgi:hypothetical protein
VRSIVGQLTSDIQDFIGEDPVDKADAYPISTYRKLVEQVAKLAYLNKDYLLFFRGQGQDFRNRAGASTFYPTIYRGDYVPQREINNRFQVLDHAARKLRDIFSAERVQGHEEVKWRRHIQWSILQHYEVCSTPLLDLTHSIRVACSFAQLDSGEESGYVYVFGLPYVMNRISHNSEHNLVTVRLLSICPPEALRPYFQEGYVTGTEDMTNEYDNKAELDFRNRLIAKFRIPTQPRFWGRGFSRIPRTVLYPRGDRIEKLCQSIGMELKTQLLPGQLGEFIQEWSDLEARILDIARSREARMFTIREAIEILSQESNIDQQIVYELHEIRKFRNLVVHEPKKATSEQLEKRISQVRIIKEQLEQFA